MLVGAWAADALSDLAEAEAVTASLEEQLVQAEVMPPCSTTHAVVARPIRAIRASSALTEGSLTHGAERAIDGDRSTAWVEGVPGHGRGESLTLALDSEGALPPGLRILPGYAKDKARWDKNGRVGELLVRWLKPAEGVEPSQAFAKGALVPTTTGPLRVTLAREDGKVPFGRWQIIDFGHDDVWLQNMEITEVVAVQLVLLAAESTGASYDDTVIGELGWVEAGPRIAHRCEAGWCATQEGDPPDGCPPR